MTPNHKENKTKFPTPRELLDSHSISKCCVMGSTMSVILYIIGSYEASILIAMLMPGVYFGFAAAYGSWTEVMEETFTCILLVYVYLQCLHNVQQVVWLAPLSIAIHGLVDLLHHFHLYPSEHHVHTCYPNYPLICASFDLASSATLASLVYFFGP